MNSVRAIFVIATSALVVAGCASNISLTSNINDFVMMGIKTNSTEKVAFDYSSTVVDGKIKPYDRDKQSQLSGHPGFNLTESSTLRRMLSEFMSNKFPSTTPDGSTKIKLSLDDFWIEQYTEASTGAQVATALFGGETDYIVVAKVKVSVTISKDGSESKKVITASSEDKFVQGVGTGTKTSNIHRGSESLENTHARNINNANNKVLMLLNAYFQELGL